MSEADFLQPGGRFGKLRLERQIGRGAFAWVWLAYAEKLRRFVALKVLRRAGMELPAPEDRARFLEEARIVATFNHPHIATLYDLHETPDGHYALELEYLDRGSLADKLGADGRLPVDEALDVARAVASALAQAHGAGVVHGDVKPGNVLLGSDGRIKLGDFGLARLFRIQDIDATSDTAAGTPQYMAPEVVGNASLQPASDVWSLGVLLYRAVSGRHPYPRSVLPSLLLAIQYEAPAPLDPDVPAEVATIIERCLAKRVEDRYRDGAELLRALERGPRKTRTARRPGTSAGFGRVTGRDAACARLERALDRLGAGAGGIQVVTGSAGIGKSALAAAATAEARERGWRALASSVSAFDGIVRPLFRAALQGAGAPGAEGSGEEATMFGLEQALASLAADRPLVVMVEDLHVASEEEVKLVGRACRRLGDERILWLVTERTSDLGLAGTEHLRADPLLADGDAERIDLEPLADEAIHRILAAEAGDVRVASAAADRIIRRSAGNPLFALQLFRHMRETGALAEERGEWRLAKDTEPGEAPPALRGLVSRRLGELPEPERALLDVAAVDGLEFDGEAVAAASEEPRVAILRRLQTLYRANGLIVPCEHGFRFAHPLLQEVIYAEVSPDLRRELHRILARHLEGRAQAADPERLGVHWERSDTPERARPHLLRAADAAAARLENFRCVDLATRAGIVPGEVPAALAREHTEALLQVANSLGEIGRREERDRLHADLLRAADELDDAVLRQRIHARRGLTAILGMGLSDSGEAEVRAAAEQLPDSEDRGIAYYVLGMRERMHGRLDRAEANLRRADEQFVGCGATARHGSVLDQLGTLATRGGRLHEAVRLYSEAARVCRETGRLANAAISDVNEISARIDMGEVDGHTERLADAARLLDVDGLLGAGARVRIARAHVHCTLGDIETARRVAQAASAVVHRVGMLAGICEAQVALSYFAGFVGELETARDELRKGLEAVERMADPHTRAILVAQAALLRARAGDPEGAAREARDAVGIARPLAEPAPEVVSRLAEAALHGMPADALPDARALLPEPTESEAATVRSARAFLDGMRAAADRAASPDELERCARVLARRDGGRDRALLRLVAEFLRAAAAERRADPEGAEELRAHAREVAARLRYAWDPR